MTDKPDKIHLFYTYIYFILAAIILFFFWNANHIFGWNKPIPKDKTECSCVYTENGTVFLNIEMPPAENK